MLDDVRVFKDEVLGRGPNGLVVAGTWRGQPVAVKCLTESSAVTTRHCNEDELASLTEEERHKRLVRDVVTETAFLVSLRHRNVVQILGVTTHPVSGLPCVVTERLLESIAQRRWRDPSSTGHMNLRDVVDVALDVVAGLRYLHESTSPVAHRNLSSKNVLLTVEGKAKIGGLGMAKVLRNRESSTTLPGEDEYMPPEVAVGESPSYSVKIDIFSLGVLVMEMANHQAPKPKARFGRRGVGITLVSETKRRADDLAELKRCQPALLPFVECCLKEEKRRPPAAQCDILLTRIRTNNKNYQKSRFTLDRSGEDSDYSLAAAPTTGLGPGSNKPFLDGAKRNSMASLSAGNLALPGVAGEHNKVTRCSSLDTIPSSPSSPLQKTLTYSKLSRMSLNVDGFFTEYSAGRNSPQPPPVLTATPARSGYEVEESEMYEAVADSTDQDRPSRNGLDVRRRERKLLNSTPFDDYAEPLRGEDPGENYLEPNDIAVGDDYVQPHDALAEAADNGDDTLYIEPQDTRTPKKTKNGLPDHGYEDIPDVDEFYDEVMSGRQVPVISSGGEDCFPSDETYDDVRECCGIARPPTPKYTAPSPKRPATPKKAVPQLPPTPAARTFAYTPPCSPPEVIPRQPVVPPPLPSLPDKPSPVMARKKSPPPLPDKLTSPPAGSQNTTSTSKPQTSPPIAPRMKRNSSSSSVGAGSSTVTSPTQPGSPRIPAKVRRIEAFHR